MSWRPSRSASIGYNTNLVKLEDAPKSFADLLDPKWKGKIVKGRPDYSGTILTATFQIARELGWSYFEKLALVAARRGKRRTASNALIGCHASTVGA